MVEIVVKIITHGDDRFKEFDNKVQKIDQIIKVLVDYKTAVFEKRSKAELDVLKAAFKKLEEGFGKFEGNVKKIKNKFHIFYIEIRKKN